MANEQNDRLLTDEEIERAIKHHELGGDPCYSGYIHPMRSVAQAQDTKSVKAMVEWGDKDCEDISHGPRRMLKRECPECWQALKRGKE